MIVRAAGNSFAFVHKMRIVPIWTSDLIALAVFAILSAVTFLTTVMPLSDILKESFLRLVA
jgi:hypothetical protein